MLIPLGPGTLVENSRCGVIQRGLEFVVAEVLPEDFNVLICGVCHRIGQKAQWEFQCFFWSAKPEDAPGDRQEFVAVDHRSLPREAKSRLPMSTGSSSNFTPLAALRNAFCTDPGSLGRSPSAK
jgi:hypothetical protein